MYRRLRCAFLNPLLENQAETREEYEKIVKGIESGNFKVITDNEINQILKRAASS
jgi:hypothetical protein